MDAILLYVLFGIAACWGLGNLFTGVLQDHFIFRPQRLPADYIFRFSSAWEEHFIESRQGGRLHVLLFRRPGARGVVLYCHGNSGSLARWGHLYQFFHRYEYDFLVYDYRGFGKSRGVRRSEALLYEDTFAVYDWLRERYAPGRIVLFGRSMGSAFASRLAAERPARTLILETPFASMADLFYTYYPFLPRLFWFKYRFDNRACLQRVACPIHIFQGTDDYIVPIRSAIKLREVLKPGDDFTVIEKGRHNDLMIYDVYQQKIQEILLRSGPEAGVDDKALKA